MDKRRYGKKAAAGLLIVLGILLCVNTLFAHLYSNDWNLGVVLPAIMGIGLMGLSLKMLLIKEPILKSKRVRVAVILLLTVCFLFFAVIEGLIIADPYTHRSELAGKVDYVIVLGCGIWPDGSPTLALMWRLDKAVEYYRHNPQVKLIVSGGKGPDEPFPEADAMEAYLIRKGIPEDRILKEDKSTSTKENFEYTKKLLGSPLDQQLRVVFITNDFHVLRSRILAERFGFKAYALFASTPPVILFNSYLREFFAFVKTMIFDY
ncbi:MAG: YdcF family protein [Clostridia bacterium]|nr:YdcF family protein [Clostridia bacterium]